jgi:hypothetical protein
VAQQSGFRFCNQCGVMTLNPPGGPCVAGGQHHAQGFLFVVNHGVPQAEGTQRNFRNCIHCRGLFLAEDLGSSDLGVCVVGGQHDRTNSHDYALAVNKPQDPINQDKWFVCVDCNLLFFGPFEGGKCVKNALGHNPGQGSPLPEYFPPHTGNPGDFIQ